ncbi:MAG: hypothetical protein AAGA53_13340 [Pseudomonadota bacterium]
MPSPFKGFLWVFGMTVIFGILVGTLNLLNPEAVHIPFGRDNEGNPQSAEGMDGLIASTLSSGVLGTIFGSIAALIAWLFRWMLQPKKNQK